MTDELMTQDRARELLEALHDKFVSAHMDAWGRWLRLGEVCREAKAAELLLPLSPTTRANFVNNHCASLVQERVAKGDGVSVRNINGLIAVLAHDQGSAAFVRFKLLDRHFNPSNVRTNVQQALSKQHWPKNLYSDLGIAPIPTVLTCGYRLTNDQSDVKGIYICCHYDRQLQWSYSIGDGAAGSGEVEHLTIPDFPTPRPRIVSTIVPEAEDEAAGSDQE